MTIERSRPAVVSRASAPRESNFTRPGVSRATEHLPPRADPRRALPTMLLRRHIDELRGDARGTGEP